jgi:hypothetical protein
MDNSIKNENLPPLRISPPPPHRPPTNNPIADSGSTIHCLKTTASNENDRHDPAGLRAAQPDGSPIISHTKCDIIESRLPPAAKIGYKFATVKQNMISIPVLCDNGCEVLLTEDDIKVTRNGIQVMNGYREPSTRLWRFNLQENNNRIQKQNEHTNFEHHVNALIPEGTAADLIKFLHKALFSPSKSTLLHAIKNNQLTTWPGTTAENVTKYLPKSVATTLGHQDQTRKMHDPHNRNRQIHQSWTSHPTQKIHPVGPTTFLQPSWIPAPEKYTPTRLVIFLSPPVVATNTFLSCTTMIATLF